MIAYKQAISDTELHQILVLQQANLPKNLTKEEKLKEGFLTVEHSFDLLKEMNNRCRHTIVTHKNKVVGYALSMHPIFCERIPVLKPMFVEINKTISQNHEYLVMGQICIAKSYRGKGLFKGLYTSMRTFMKPMFSKIITEVDTQNIRSINAHSAIGFKELKRYHDGKKEWSLICLE